MNLDLDKNFLRQKFKKLKQDILSKKKFFLDKDINENILSLSEYKSSDIILAYMANQIEINIDDLILKSINNKKIAVPKCLDFNRDPQMDFYFIDSLFDVSVGKFNIREPNILKNNIVDNNIVLDKKVIMLVPGLVFDKKGYRVGYGKGYYDRYLSQLGFDILKIGLCYDFCLINKINIDKNDIPVDILVTETKIIKF